MYNINYKKEIYKYFQIKQEERLKKYEQHIAKLNKMFFEAYSDIYSEYKEFKKNLISECYFNRKIKGDDRQKVFDEKIQNFFFQKGYSSEIYFFTKTHLKNENDFSECLKCFDCGYIHEIRKLDDEKKHLYDFTTMDKCKCYYKALSEIIRNEESIKNLLIQNNFHKFNSKLFDNSYNYNEEHKTPYKNIEDIKNYSIKYINSFKKDDFEEQNLKRNLLFYGMPGSGKTFMACSIMNEVLNLNKIVQFYNSVNLSKFLQQYSITNDKSEALIDNYRLLFECDLLIIDDLGSEKTSNFTLQEFYNIINTRLINGKNLIITMNPYETLASDIYGYICNILDGRLASRIMGVDFFKAEFYEDLRIKLDNLYM